MHTCNTIERKGQISSGNGRGKSFERRAAVQFHRIRVRFRLCTRNSPPFPSENPPRQEREERGEECGGSLVNVLDVGTAREWKLHLLDSIYSSAIFKAVAEGDKSFRILKIFIQTLSSLLNSDRTIRRFAFVNRNFHLYLLRHLHADNLIPSIVNSALFISCSSKVGTKI